MRPTHVVVEVRPDRPRFFVRQGGVWTERPRWEVDRSLLRLAWEYREPLPPPDPEWLRSYFAETVQVALTSDRIFVKHPNGRWIEASFFIYGVACYPIGPSYSGVELPPPARTHHRVSAGSISYSDGMRRDLWWCLGCNEQGDGAPRLHPEPRKEVSA